MKDPATKHAHWITVLTSDGGRMQLLQVQFLLNRTEEGNSVDRAPLLYP
jgi:hypothetical protein